MKRAAREGIARCAKRARTIAQEQAQPSPSPPPSIDFFATLNADVEGVIFDCLDQASIITLSATCRRLQLALAKRCRAIAFYDVFGDMARHGLLKFLKRIRPIWDLLGILPSAIEGRSISVIKWLGSTQPRSRRGRVISEWNAACSIALGKCGCLDTEMHFFNYFACSPVLAWQEPFFERVVGEALACGNADYAAAVAELRLSDAPSTTAIAIGAVRSGDLGLVKRHVNKDHYAPSQLVECLISAISAGKRDIAQWFRTEEGGLVQLPRDCFDELMYAAVTAQDAELFDELTRDVESPSMLNAINQSPIESNSDWRIRSLAAAVFLDADAFAAKLLKYCVVDEAFWRFFFSVSPPKIATKDEGSLLNAQLAFGRKHGAAVSIEHFPFAMRWPSYSAWVSPHIEYENVMWYLAAWNGTDIHTEPPRDYAQFFASRRAVNEFAYGYHSLHPRTRRSSWFASVVGSDGVDEVVVAFCDFLAIDALFHTEPRIINRAICRLLGELIARERYALVGKILALNKVAVRDYYRWLVSEDFSCAMHRMRDWLKCLDLFLDCIGDDDELVSAFVAAAIEAYDLSATKLLLNRVDKSIIEDGEHLKHAMRHDAVHYVRYLIEAGMPVYDFCIVEAFRRGAFKTLHWFIDAGILEGMWGPAGREKWLNFILEELTPADCARVDEQQLQAWCARFLAAQ